MPCVLLDVCLAAGRAAEPWRVMACADMQAAEAAGKDFERVKALHMTVEQAERHVKKRTPKEMDETVDRTTHEYGWFAGRVPGPRHRGGPTGVGGPLAAGYQQYLQLVKKVKANKNAYERTVEGVDCRWGVGPPFVRAHRHGWQAVPGGGCDCLLLQRG
jgi:hypothetical protein